MYMECISKGKRNLESFDSSFNFEKKKETLVCVASKLRRLISI